MAVTITNAGLDLVRDALNGVAGINLKITYIALGTGTQGTPATATQLAAEVFRKQITSYANGAAHGEGIINGYISPQDSVGTVISEVGYFAGAATGTANSGTLVAYSPYSHTHTNAESIQLQLDNTV
jgi:hypothetical protein